MFRYCFATLLAVFFVALLYSCDTGLQGSMNENIYPRTYLTINEINLDHEDDSRKERLVSQIHISWWGDDPDGYVVGYEYVITEKEWQYTRDTEDQVEWTYTQQTDSVFVLPIPPGEDVADVRFTVRAVDNNELRDPNGASVVFPIRNSPPSIQLHKTVTPRHDMEIPPDTTFHIASFGWTASDPDGDDNLSHYEVAINDTSAGWLQIPVDASFLSVKVDEINGSVGTASVFIGRSFRPSELRLEPFRLNDENTFYIRALDNALAVSQVDSVSWFMKEQKSNILIINDFPGTIGNQALPFHMELLRSLGIENYDYLDIRDGETSGGRKVAMTRAFHRPVDPTMNKIFAEWDHIYWISGDLDRNITYALRSTLTFFENGGTMFVNIPTKSIPDNDAVLDFLPFEKVTDPPGFFSGYQIPVGRWLVPASETGLDSLKIRREDRQQYPMEPLGDFISYYDADFQLLPFHDPDVEFSRLLVAGTPERNLIHFGYNIHWIEAGEALNNSMRTLLKELNFPVVNPEGNE